MIRTGTYYHDPGPAPTEASKDLRDRWIAEVVRKQSQLAVDAAVTIDISPGAFGNNPLGSNAGHGRALNPSTGQPYAPQVVPLGDFGRVMAEFWADGPKSETPPGHWNVIANGVTDSVNFSRALGGTGPGLPQLEWDVKVYLALNGALHDAAITAWEIKRDTTTARPISLVRYLATADSRGLLPEPGVVEVRSGTLQVRGWQPGAGVQWEPATVWVPYQRSTFVTPAFPGFISGHSTFSRASRASGAGSTSSPTTSPAAGSATRWGSTRWRWRASTTRARRGSGLPSRLCVQPLAQTQLEAAPRAPAPPTPASPTSDSHPGAPALRSAAG